MSENILRVIWLFSASIRIAEDFSYFFEQKNAGSFQAKNLFNPMVERLNNHPQKPLLSKKGGLLNACRVPAGNRLFSNWYGKNEAAVASSPGVFNKISISASINLATSCLMMK
jgi:hypothetical protein